MNFQRLVLPKDVLVPVPQVWLKHFSDSAMTVNQCLLTVYLMSEPNLDTVWDVFSGLLDDASEDTHEHLVNTMVECYTAFKIKVSPYLDFLFLEHNAGYVAFAEMDMHHGLLVVELEFETGPSLH